jgi:hypothetical protein
LGIRHEISTSLFEDLSGPIDLTKAVLCGSEQRVTKGKWIKDVRV